MARSSLAIVLYIDSMSSNYLEKDTKGFQVWLTYRYMTSLVAESDETTEILMGGSIFWCAISAPLAISS